MNNLVDAPLGQSVVYPDQYDAKQLFPIERALQRQVLGVSTTLPFYGDDVWYAYELSWLNPRGKPEVALGKFTIPCDSPCLIESKSFKLYLNSFNGTQFSSLSAVQNILKQDLSAAAGKEIDIEVTLLADLPNRGSVDHFSGFCLDKLDIACDTYMVHPGYLTCSSDKEITAVLYSDLLKSNCLKTGQPDWASVQITYTGKEIDKEGLLRYIVSLRNHLGFHEDCIEHIFMDIMKHCAPRELTVDGRYTRRGGLDINPRRSTLSTLSARSPERLWRQ